MIIFIGAIDKSREQYNRHVTKLKILPTRTKAQKAHEVQRETRNSADLT
jgi:hypothetical protein